jgi:hypothetical protein
MKKRFGEIIPEFPIGLASVRVDCVNFRLAPMENYQCPTNRGDIPVRLTRLFGLIRGVLMALATLLAAALPAAAETAEARPAALLKGLIETNDPGLAVLVFPAVRQALLHPLHPSAMRLDPGGSDAHVTPTEF